jgi:hypothetical protein
MKPWRKKLEYHGRLLLSSISEKPAVISQNDYTMVKDGTKKQQ